MQRRVLHACVQLTRERQSIDEQFAAARLEARIAFRNRFPNPSDPNSQLAAIWAYRICCGQIEDEI